MLTRIKKRIQSMLRKEAEIANEVGLTPDHLSIIGLLSGLFSGLLYWLAGVNMFNPAMSRVYLLAAIIMLLISGFMDALDGALARIYGKASAKGGFLDSLIDRYVDSAIYIGIILGGLCDLLWGLLALIGSLLTSYARARSEAEGVPMETIGLFERAERIIVIIVASLLNVFGIDIIRWGILLLAIATNLTVLQRTIFFFRKGSK